MGFYLSLSSPSPFRQFLSPTLSLTGGYRDILKRKDAHTRAPLRMTTSRERDLQAIRSLDHMDSTATSGDIAME